MDPCYGLPADERFDRVLRTLMRLMEVPAAIVAVLQDDGPWLRAMHGLPPDDARHALAFCDPQLLGENVLMVADASINPLFSSNVLVAGEPHFRSFVAVPLLRAPGVPAGVLGAFHVEPRAFRHVHVTAMQDLARLTEAEIRLDALTAMHKRVLARVSQLEQRLQAARTVARREA